MANNFTTIRKFLKQVKREVILEPDITYDLLGVKWYGKGVFIRETKLGKEIKANKLYRIETNDFIYNRLFAWKSSFAVIPKEFDGCLVSAEFPTFIFNKEEVDIDFILNYILLPNNIHKIDQLSTGMSSVSRKRFKEHTFLSFPIPLVDLKKQKSISTYIFKHNSFHQNLCREIEYQQSLLIQLRQAILQEAVEGNLTAEWRKTNPELISGENHATRLFEKIKAEKERLIKEGKIKKQKPLPSITDEEKPFALPDGWVWCRLGDIANGFQYGSSSKSDKKGKIPVLRMGNIQNGFIDWSNLVYSSDPDDISKLFLKKNDLLFNRTNSRELVGKTCIYEGERDAIFAGYLVRFHMLGSINSYYANSVMNSTLHREWCNEVKTDALGQSNINATKLKYFRFTLPPLAEQQAIVEKIEQLMAKIDALEQQVSDRKEQAEQLMQAVLREAFEGA